MTAASAAARHYVPARNAATVLAVAMCNGDGLIVVRTEDGPETAACLGCRNCVPAPAPTGEHALLAEIRDHKRRAANLRDVFADGDLDDSPF